MPYPNFHSCRIREPNTFESGSFRTLHTKTKGLTIIVGTSKSTGKSALQAYRYNKVDWNNDRASKHCNARGGRFEGATTKKTCDVFGDHSFLHLIWNKVKKEKEWGGWNEIEIIKEHARITDELRRNGYSMHPKSVLDSSSREFEDTVKMLTPSDIPHLLEPGAKDIFQTKTKRKKKEVKLGETIFYGNLKMLEDTNDTSDYVCLTGNTDTASEEINIVIRAKERSIELEQKITNQFPEEIRESISFVYDVDGPSSSYVSLFDLVLKPNEKLEIVNLNENLENEQI